MAPRALHPPIWLLGFGLWPLGVNLALLLITMPQLLAAQHTSESRIAGITAMALAPGFVSFLMAPLRLVRRDRSQGGARRARVLARRGECRLGWTGGRLALILRAYRTGVAQAAAAS